MKRQDYRLTIENPCKKEWNSMTGTDVERYCSLCSKSVMDFTNLTDQQVLDKIKNANGKVCGRLTESQIKRDFKEIEQGTSSSSVPKILGGLLLLFSADKVNAGDTKPDIEIVENLQKNEERDIKNINQKETPKDTLKNTIQGQIIDADTKEPIIFAEVLVKNSRTGTTTDENGNFWLTIPDSLMTEQIVLSVRYLGYNYAEFPIQSTDLPLLSNILTLKIQEVIMGEVCCSKRKKWWQFWKKK